jgi:ABC-2 type transport system ATP-binding protein
LNSFHELELIDVSAGYSHKEILHKINIKTPEPSIYVVAGPNGAGKTTLFRTISGILEPTSGSVLFDSVDVSKSKEMRSRINYLSHLNALPEEMTVENALSFYAEVEGGDIEHVLNLLSLQELRKKKISTLSQGQKKRAAIGKIFLRDRDLYLLDEPTANVDPKISKEIRELLLTLSKDKLVFYSSHNLYEAREIGTYLILINNGSVQFFDKIDQIKPKHYRIGIRSPDKISEYLHEAKLNNGYYVMDVLGPSDVSEIIKELVYKGARLTEVKELDNPLEELFDRGV